MRLSAGRGSLGAISAVVLSLVIAGCGGGSGSGASPTSAGGGGAGSGSAASSPKGIAALKQAAEKEGQVNWYTTFSQSDVQPMIDAFHKTYPNIKVNALRLSADKLPARVITEQRGGKYNADVISGDAVYVWQLKTADALQGYHAQEEVPLPGGTHLPKGYDNVVYVNTTAPAWNPQALQRLGLQPPKTFKDFSDPKWKGHFSVDPGAVNWYQSLITEYGHDQALKILQAIGNNSPKLVESHTLAVTQVQAGEPAATVTAYAYKALSYHKKTPNQVDFVNPSPLPATLTLIEMAKKAPHPSAGELFLDWILSKQGQTTVVNVTNHISVRNDVDNDPKLWNPSKWSPAWADPTVSPDTYNSYVREMKQALHAG